MYNELQLYPHKMTVIYELTAHDKLQKQRLGIIGYVEYEEVTMHNVWFSDEVHFHLNGTVSKQMYELWHWEIHVCSLKKCTMQ